jgi:outer membrane protein OmpA-like peptidoglycan-associated protein
VLAETSLAKLSQITATVKERQPCGVRIGGHTDTAGPARKNWKLGLQRAQTVKQILIDQGIDVDQIQAASHGEKDLFIRTSDNTLEPRNRRAEVILH